MNKIFLIIVCIALFGCAWTSFAYAESIISQENWTVHYVDSEEVVAEDGKATDAFDGNVLTFWHTQWDGSSPQHPHEIQINLGKKYNIEGFQYLPRQDSQNGRVGRYEFYTSIDGLNWGSQAVTGVFENEDVEKTIMFSGVMEAQYVRFVALSEVNGRQWTTIAELNILETEEVHKVTVTWDFPPGETMVVATGFDIRVNKDDSSLISVSKDVREWTGEVGLIPGQNVFDMRTKAKNDKFSVWSEPAYYTLSFVLSPPSNLNINNWR